VAAARAIAVLAVGVNLVRLGRVVGRSQLVYRIIAEITNPIDRRVELSKAAKRIKGKIVLVENTRILRVRQIRQATDAIVVVNRGNDLAARAGSY